MRLLVYKALAQSLSQKFKKNCQKYESLLHLKKLLFIITLTKTKQEIFDRLFYHRLHLEIALIYSFEDEIVRQ